MAVRTRELAAAAAKDDHTIILLTALGVVAVALLAVLS
jgi:hypothetical protein